jgi:spermidine synthase
VLAVGLVVVQPRWDARLYAVGVHLRISDFADPTLDAVRRFADEGWELLYYDQGATGAVAVGRSTKTGNTWLSVNGKVDASTGDDMPTQQLSGAIPVALARHPARVVVVGLASGVTVGAALEDPRVAHLTVLELEPSVVPASHFFDHVNGRPLDDIRTELVLDDARAWLARHEGPFDVVISEPSNPWITGVSNLFTLEYWALARDRLSEGGVFAQWVQLYGMGPEEVRGLLRTFQHVFGDVWVFETIDGTDLLVVGGRGLPPLPVDLPLRPRLDPDGVRCIAGTGWLNTDDRPVVEWRAPAYLHYSTADANRHLLDTTCP